MGKYRMQEPWGYQEENDYTSNNPCDTDIDGLFSKATYDKGQNKMFFYDKYGTECSSIDVSEFEEESIVDKAYYDKTTQEIVIEFVNGDVVRLNVKDILDETEFKDGLQVVDGQVSVLIDETGEGYEGNPYLSTSLNGVKISGIDKHIHDDVETEKLRAVSEETRIEAKLDQEISDRISDVNEEESRAKNEEAAINRRIDRLNDELDAEKTIREASDVSENRRALNAESELRRLITEESSVRESADTAITAEIEALKTKDGELEAELNLKASEASLNALQDSVNSHISNSEVHVTTDDKNVWNNKVDSDELLPYAKTNDVNEALSLKADTTAIYTQEQVDEMLAVKEGEIIKANNEIYTLKKAVGDIGGNVTYDLPGEGKSFNTLMSNNGTVKLSEDVTAGRFGPGMTAKNKTTLNLNNHDLIVSGLTESSSYPGILVRGTEEITIGGKGTIDTGEGICIETASANAIVNLTGSSTTYQTNRSGGELIYCYSGTINISNGIFRNNGDEKKFTLNCYDANYKNGTAKIIVTGGKFYDFDPGNNEAEGPNTSFLAEGYHTESSIVTEEGVEHTIYTVKKD